MKKTGKTAQHNGLWTLWLMAAAMLLGGCGVSAYQPGRAANFDLTPNYEISDGDIAQAFEARPQMPPQLNVAFYSFDPGKSAELGQALEAIPEVNTVYHLPELMVTGKGRYDHPRPRWEARQAPSLKKMRLLAARAHCDVLIIFDYGYEVEKTPNGWMALNVLLLPTFFTPWLDQEADSHMDAYIIDTRNGYLYAHVESHQNDQRDAVTLYDEDQALVKEQWGRILDETSGALTKIIGQQTQASASKAP